TLRPEVKHTEVERVILVELERIARELVSDEEFARVKRQLLASNAFATDTITWRAFHCGRLLSTGAALSIADWYAKLSAVTREQIRDAARDDRAKRLGLGRCGGRAGRGRAPRRRLARSGIRGAGTRRGSRRTARAHVRGAAPSRARRGRPRVRARTIARAARARRARHARGGRSRLA